MYAPTRELHGCCHGDVSVPSEGAISILDLASQPCLLQAEAFTLAASAANLNTQANMASIWLELTSRQVTARLVGALSEKSDKIQHSKAHFQGVWCIANRPVFCLGPGISTLCTCAGNGNGLGTPLSGPQLTGRLAVTQARTRQAQIPCRPNYTGLCCNQHSIFKRCLFSGDKVSQSGPLGLLRWHGLTFSTVILC